MHSAFATVFFVLCTRCGKIARKKAAKIPNVQRRCNATIEQDLIELKSSRFVGHAHHGRDTRPHDCGRLYVLHVYLFVNQLNCGLVKNEFQPTNSWLLCLVIKNKPAPIADVLVVWLTFHWWKWRRHTTRAYDHRREPIVTIVLAFALSRSRSYSRRVRIRAMLIAIEISKLRNAIADCNLQGQRFTVRLLDLEVWV